MDGPDDLDAAVLGDVSPGAQSRYRARIESIELDRHFVVVSGWAVLPDGAAPDEPISLTIDGARHEVHGLFPRGDLSAVGISSAACSFRIDLPKKAPLNASSELALWVGQARVTEETFDDIETYPFQPIGAFDTLHANSIAGWAFCPGLWHEEGAAPRLALTIGDLRLPVQLDVRRHDLPFSSAKTGRALGFTVRLRDLLEAEHPEAVDTVFDGGRQEVELMLGNQSIARSALVLDVVGRPHAVPEAPRVEAAPAMASPTPVTPQRVAPPPAAVKETPQIAAKPAEPAKSERAVTGAQPPEQDSGYIDFFGYSPGLGGWIFGGWIRSGLASDGDFNHGIAIFSGVNHSGPIVLHTYQRPDVVDFGVGILVFFAGEKAPGSLQRLIVQSVRTGVMKASDEAVSLSEADLLRTAKQILRHAEGEPEGAFWDIISRPVFDGADTVSQLDVPVFIGIDEMVRAPGAGLVLIGWFLDPTRSVKAMRVRCGAHCSNDLYARWLGSDRPDIKEAYGVQLGLDHARWGFTSFAEIELTEGEPIYLEINLGDGALAFKPLPAATRSGVAGIMRILADAALTPDIFVRACREVLGPPARAINRERLAKSERPFEALAGTPPQNPRCSIVVPLYGRLDFMMYQMALMSEQGMEQDEMIYVLDQPPKKEEFLDLARSTYLRFGIPMRLILPPSNLGFAGASDAGMDAARGRYVCFLNSDVMPREPRWLDLLTDAIEEDPKIGLIGGQLLFEDGTIQHAGMDFERMPQFGNWLFPFHPGKGRCMAATDGVRRVPAVTGACMVMRRDLAVQLGGFDTEYIIGDFEDADLCMKVRAEGLDCAVHDGAILYHLERQSQGASANRSRMNLTLVNACTFTERWDSERASAADPSAPLQLV
ncbi:glycosyltransferase [Terrihabitans sp. B22-R8]|uniref:glycosyltransferase n=1 Tax=Terrihabitans sp. B22-R8 TaxID=3425128 RepID=UPI00403CAD11